ncbi:hypothetical protein [Leptospira kanakyensis]|uniref:hypothetical protein n=1 Tax=Leptospira kanakyensis TaxID=2484968 RepID=UPI00223D14B7|nr:hypothetical protein [Leptospira kanakyensis]MCW7470970.1 hypothetical protein [Leptospira kanakyensis]
MKKMRQIMVIGITLFLFHCANTSYYQTWGKNKVRMNGFSTSEGYTVYSKFNFSFTRVYLFWGLSNVRDKSLDELLAEIYLKYPNASIGDLKIAEEYEFSDGMVDLVTGGIVRPYTLHIKGNVYTLNQRTLKK